MTMHAAVMVVTLRKLASMLSAVERFTPDQTMPHISQIRMEPPMIEGQFWPLPNTGKK